MFDRFKMVFSGLATRARPVSFILKSGLQHATENIGRIEAITCGFMLGSSAVLPILFSTTVGLRGYFKMDLGISIVSIVGYGILNRSKVVENSPIVVAVYSVAGLLAFLSPQPVLNELPPWLPLWVVMGLLMSVSVIPWIKENFRPGPAPALRGLLVHAGNRPEGSAVGTVDPNSAPSSSASNSSASRSFRSSTDPWQFAHFGHLGVRILPRYNAEDDTSSIDLEEGLQQGLGTNPNSEAGGSEHPLLYERQSVFTHNPT